MACDGFHVKGRQASNVNGAKKVPLALLSICLVTVLLGGVVPANASGPATTGTQLNLIRVSFNDGGTCDPTFTYCTGGTTTLPANSPFFVRHGVGAPGSWTQLPEQDRVAFQSNATRFDLYVDGSLVFSIRYLDYSTQYGMTKWFLTNFPAGMTGTHTFEGQWFEDGELVGGVPGQAVLELDITISVTFV